jgi:hypothetical protein
MIRKSERASFERAALAECWAANASGRLLDVG